MGKYSFADVKQLLSAGDVEIMEVCAFWRQACLVRKPSPEHTLIAIPATLHLAGRMNAVAYAEMPVATGSRVREAQPPGALAWLTGKSRERRLATLLRFSLPDIGLFWRGEAEDKDALALARRFAEVLGREFPRPVEELTRHFHMETAKLVDYLSEATPPQADGTHAGKVP